jgi:pyruvate ferredoxin oxidoreductase gamma subunit/2-oxoisovalerate ferredoxin oxidoreductase gamma subunit
MVEIRVHGRGGQGAVVASKVLAEAVFTEGQWVQAFPSFGVERRGAPVAAFIRIDDKPVRLRNEIYEPDHIIVLDPTLISTGIPTAGLKPGGTVLINSPLPPAEWTSLGPYRIATVDASRIAADHRLGSRAQPIVNTAIIGAFVNVVPVCSLDAVADAVKNNVPVKHEENAAAAREAYRAVVVMVEA